MEPVPKEENLIKNEDIVLASHIILIEGGSGSNRYIRDGLIGGTKRCNLDSPIIITDQKKVGTSYACVCMRVQFTTSSGCFVAIH
jgi:hypothetical protein